MAMVMCKGDSAVSVNQILPRLWRCGYQKPAESFAKKGVGVSILDLDEPGWHNDTYTSGIVEV